MNKIKEDLKLKLSIVMAFLLISVASSVSASEQLSIEGIALNPTSSVISEWLGEPPVGTITDYGVERVGLYIAFMDEPEVIQFVEERLSFTTQEEIHGVHIHGTGSNHALDRITGYSIIFGDEESQRYQIQTYVRQAQHFALASEFSGDAVGALDCASVAKLAILHSPANTEVISITLGKNFFPGDPKSEDKYAQSLSEATEELARERAH